MCGSLRLSNPVEADALRQSQKPRLHVSRKRRDFRSDRFVEDFHPPNHEILYLIFEIGKAALVQFRCQTASKDARLNPPRANGE